MSKREGRGVICLKPFNNMTNPLPVPSNSWDELCNIFTLVMHDGGTLTGMSYGAFTVLICGILLPAAMIFLIISAASGLGNSKAARLRAIIFLCAGLVCVVIAVALVAYAVIAGPTWAFQSYK